MSGYTFRPIRQLMKDGIPGLQLGFDNDYGVSLMPDSYSDDDRFENATMSVGVFKGTKGQEEETKTLDVMARMSYQPNYHEIKNLMFLGVSPAFLIRILDIVNNMEMQ